MPKTTKGGAPKKTNPSVQRAAPKPNARSRKPSFNTGLPTSMAARSAPTGWRTPPSSTVSKRSAITGSPKTRRARPRARREWWAAANRGVGRGRRRQRKQTAPARRGPPTRHSGPVDDEKVGVGRRDHEAQSPGARPLMTTKELLIMSEPESIVRRSSTVTTKNRALPIASRAPWSRRAGRPRPS